MWVGLDNVYTDFSDEKSCCATRNGPVFSSTRNSITNSEFNKLVEAETEMRYNFAIENDFDTN